MLPVPESSLKSVAIFGGVDAPGHTLPTGHGGLFLEGTSAPLSSPGDMTVIQLRRVRYMGDDVPAGAEDYAIFFRVCPELTGWFCHVAALAPVFSPATVDYRDCRTYSTPFATVETCEASVEIRVLPGNALGTAGSVTDMGMVDERVTNFYVSPHRFGGPNHAVCMWDQFDAPNQDILYAKLRDLRRPHIVPEGEPRCGTMEVDVAGTAKGVWAESGVTGPVGADERAHLAFVDRRTSGRVNRAFEDVTPDGQIYCYGPEVEYGPVSSWFLTLTSTTALTIERIQHDPGPSPCEDDPATWSFSSNAVSMVR